MNIVTYSNADIRGFLSNVKGAYESSKTVSLPYSFWLERFLNLKFETSSGQKNRLEPGVIRYTSTNVLFKQFKTVEQKILKLNEDKLTYPDRSTELDSEIFNTLKNIFVPEYEFYYDGKETFRDLPIWFLDTKSSVEMIIGPENLDMSKPTGITFDNETVHSNLQGTTGCGKSVALRDIVFNLMMLYPPWELDIVMIDSKGSEAGLYAKKVQSAHCKIIAATDAKDFLLDLYNSFVVENSLRQQILRQTGCSNLKDFRVKFDLVLPRTVIIIDEFLQYLLAIEESVNAGNKSAGAELDATFSVLAKIGSLGRNVGLHLLISSQDLGPKLKSVVANQIQSGIVLACSSEISNSTIGNNIASTEIDRHGITYINSKRLMSDNGKYNVMVGVPFIDDIQHPNEPYNIPEKMLIELDDVRKRYNFYKGFYFYDATLQVSSTKLYEALKECKDEILKDPMSYSLIIPIGETISYTKQATGFLKTSYKPNEVIAIASKTDVMLKYMSDIILKGCKNVKDDRLKVNVYYSGDVTLKLLEGTSLLKECNLERVKLLYTGLFEVAENRLKVMELQELLTLEGLEFNTLNSFKVLSQNKCPRLDLYNKYKNKLNGDNDVYNIEKLGDIKTLQIVEESEPMDTQMIVDILVITWLLKTTRSQFGIVGSSVLSECLLPPILNYWFNPEDFDNIFESNFTSRFQSFLSNSSKVNITNVVYSDMWKKLRGCIHTVNSVLEYSTRDFADEIGLNTFTSNVNEDSLIIHDKRKTKTTLIKTYGGI